jgi:hypothetical protein
MKDFVALHTYIFGWGIVAGVSDKWGFYFISLD